MTKNPVLQSRQSEFLISRLKFGWADAPSHTEHRRLFCDLDDRLDDLFVLEEGKTAIGGSYVALSRLARVQP